jgi:hypothetical protein
MHAAITEASIYFLLIHGPNVSMSLDIVAWVFANNNNNVNSPLLCQQTQWSLIQMCYLYFTTLRVKLECFSHACIFLPSLFVLT